MTQSRCGALRPDCGAKASRRYPEAPSRPSRTVGRRARGRALRPDPASHHATRHNGFVQLDRPDFFIAGAPKCGTTALAGWLAQHPKVFMPVHKEPYFFGDDLTHRHGRPTRREYEAIFAPAAGDQLTGDASTWSLWSTSAAAEIRAARPDARIFIMLRNPVDMMYSLHAEMVWEADEDVLDFATAVDLDVERANGRSLPRGIGRPETVRYRSAADFASQVTRYLSTFPAEQVHIIIFDDLVADAGSVYRGAVEFLGLEPHPGTVIDRRNASKVIRSRALQRVLLAPPWPISATMPTFRRSPLSHRIRGWLLEANSRVQPRPPLDLTLRRRLTNELRPAIERLEALIGRDLSEWKRVDS